MSLLVVLAASCGDDDGATSVSTGPQQTTATTTTVPAPTTVLMTVVPATVPADWSTYESSQFGYSIDYPPEWVVTPATAEWPPSGFPFPNGASVDRFGPTTTSTMWVYVSSVDLDQGLVARQELDVENPLACKLSNRHSIEIAGNPARHEEQFCFGRDYLIEVLAETDDRFYLIDIISSGSEITEAERATFEAMLESFQFA